MSSSPPTTLGKYQIIREIARSNDVVYEAYDPLLNRRVAVKELAMPSGTSSAQQEDRVNRFNREARAAGKLAHPNIMTVYENGEENGRFYIAMEFLDGHSLRNEIDTKGFIEPERAIEIALEALRGMEFAHTNGVIHRDIKPDNIQLLSDGRVKITDFGIARLTHEPNLTMDGQVFGTPSYMSPEQIVGREIDARSDLFSLGAVLYEMLAGKKPFVGDSVVSITYAVMNQEPTQPPQANYAVWQVLQRALDKSPALRYASAKEMIEALDSALQTIKSGSVVLGVPPPVAAASGYAAFTPPSSYPASAYGGPGGSAAIPAPPPVLYGYNPYGGMPPGQGMPGGAVPMAGVPGMGGLTNVPIYYPPPPRQPLLKPETKQTMGRVFTALVLIGTLVALVLVLVTSLSKVLSNYQQDKHDEVVVSAFTPKDPSAPVEVRIAEREAHRSQLTSPGSIAAENAAIAALYDELGRKQLDQHNSDGAEQSFTKATELDPAKSSYFSDLGSLYAAVASGQRDPGQSVSLWKLSTMSLQQAADLETSPSTRAKYSEGAAISSYEAALGYSQAGKRMEARQLLYTARTYAPTNSDVAHRIAVLMDQLNGG